MNRLKTLREEREYSVRGLDNKIGIDFNSIFRYENETRDPNTTTLKKFADFFEVTIDYLLSYSDCFIYCSYENDNFKFKIRDDYYTELKKKNFIFFKDDKRFINLNKLFHIDKKINLLPLFIEFTRIDRTNLKILEKI